MGSIPETSDSTTQSPNERIHSLLNRPIEQRRMEFRYRCAQAIVFGLPVIGLQLFGSHLSAVPREADRWVGIMQALLAGWVTYVAATGMLAEGIMTYRHRPSMDLLVGILAVGLYLFSVISVLGVFFTGYPFYGPLLFYVVVILLGGWCGYRWWGLRSV